MNPEYYFQKGLRLIVASAVIFALIVLFSAMVSRGFPLWLALVLLVPAGLGVTGFYFFSVGSSADLSERFFRRFGCCGLSWKAAPEEGKEILAALQTAGLAYEAEYRVLL